MVEQAVRRIAAAYNNQQGLRALLDSRQFYDRSRLLETIATGVPRNARMRVRSIGGISTLQQFTRTAAGGEFRVSTVTAIVDLQLEFTVASLGFRRLTGRSEFTFQVTQRLAR